MNSISIYELKLKYYTLKYFKLIICIIIDLVGMSSLAAPGAGDIPDLLWAFIHTALLKWMFTANDLFSTAFWDNYIYAFSKVKGAYKSFTFWEEILPFTDIVPSGCLSWRRHHYKGNNTWQRYIERAQKRYLIRYS